MAGALGAELGNVDLAQQHDPEQLDEVRNALHEFGIIVLRDQDITSKQYLAFARHFGDILPYPLVQGLPDHPDIVPVLKKEDERVNFGGIWHSDTVYLETPPMASLLYAVEVPEHGGDTLFANQALAYQSLSETMKNLLCGLTAINIAGKPAVMNTRSERIVESGSRLRAEQFSANHPAVRTHPETGTKAIYVNRAHSQGFLELSEKEGKALLDFIFEHQVRAEFCCRFKWTPGTLAIWDNRWMQHYPVNDYHRHRRIMHRVTLRGDKPFLNQ